MELRRGRGGAERVTRGGTTSEQVRASNTKPERQKIIKIVRTREASEIRDKNAPSISTKRLFRTDIHQTQRAVIEGTVGDRVRARHQPMRF